MENTIAAIATPYGNGGIGIIRISGKNAFDIIDRIFKTNDKNKKIHHHICYGYIVNPKTNCTIDEVLVSYFVAPNSYTKENVVEINCHGGSVIIKEILNIVLENGAFLAEPGEFTKRAFLNGRIDLSQAEAVIDVINSKTANEAKSHLNQLKGFLSQKIEEIKNELLDLMAYIEANIDYPEYDIEEMTNQKILCILKKIDEKMYELLKSFESGKILKEGVTTVIIGKPNAR